VTITWERDDEFAVGERRFFPLPDGEFLHGPGHHPTENDFFIFKHRALVERYAKLIDELRPQRIFELGIFGGGSTVFFAAAAPSARVVAIDLKPVASQFERLQQHVTAGGLDVRAYAGVDQTDRARLAQIVADDFDDAPLDLVVDDCSHLYGPSRASFNELFPRLRPGGAYVIEDWPWAHPPVGDEDAVGMYPDETPLTRLLFEIVLAIPGAPGVATDITIYDTMAVIRRGEAEVDRATFDIAACSNPRGRALLADA
jgi:predicted O-methyltransferase YrrM